MYLINSFWDFLFVAFFAVVRRLWCFFLLFAWEYIDSWVEKKHVNTIYVKYAAEQSLLNYIYTRAMVVD